MLPRLARRRIEEQARVVRVTGGKVEEHFPLSRPQPIDPPCARCVISCLLLYRLLRLSGHGLCNVAGIVCLVSSDLPDRLLDEHIDLCHDPLVLPPLEITVLFMCVFPSSRMCD